MCLVGFASLQSPWAHTLKASLPCLLLPLHRPSPFLQPLQKNTYHLSCLYLPLHQPLHPHNLLKSTSIASPRTTTLAPLAEGEVLSPEKIRATTGGIAFLPHPFRFSDTSVNNPSIVGSASHCNRSSPLHKGAKGDSALPTIPKPHYPSPRTNTLASPRKRGGGTAVEFFRLAVQYSDSLTFMILKQFQAVTVGIAPHPHHQ